MSKDLLVNQVCDALDKKQHSKDALILLGECEKWSKEGIHSVSCMYSGSGDSGQIDGFEIDGENTYNLSDYIMCAFENLTFAEVSGDGVGGGGVIKVDVDNYTITRSEYAYVQITKPFPDEEL